MATNYTIEDLAREYAERVRNAARSQALAKSTSDTQKTAAPEIATELRAIFKEIDGLKIAESGAPLPSARQEQLLSAIDHELDLTEPVFVMLKKGSVQNSLDYQARLADLVSRIQYKAPARKSQP
jgi:hypothetical protein